MGSLGCVLTFGIELLPEVFRNLSPVANSLIPHIPDQEVGARMIGGNLESAVLGRGRLSYWFLG